VPRSPTELSPATANSSTSSALNISLARRATLAASELPNGRAFYAHKIREFTTLDLAPDAIHKIGLSEVDRISGEMNAVMKQVGFNGDFAAFLQFLRTDPRFYAKTPEELLQRAAWIAKRMDGKLPRFSRHFPAALHRRARTGGHRAEIYERPLRRRAAGQHAAGHLLGKHVHAQQPAALQPGVAHAPRSGTRASSADRAEPRARRPSELPPLLVHLGIR